MYITEARRNLSANKSRLKKAKHPETVASILEQVGYWEGKEMELIERYRQLEAARVG